jgi:hypothetical protein
VLHGQFAQRQVGQRQKITNVGPVGLRRRHFNVRSTSAIQVRVQSPTVTTGPQLIRSNSSFDTAWPRVAAWT